MVGFGRWGFSFEQWLEGGARNAPQTDAFSRLISRVPLLTLLPASESLPAVNVPPQHDASVAMTPVGTTAAPLSAETPIVWLLPEADSPSAPVVPPAVDAPAEGSATASFLTPAGDHIDFQSGQPELGLVGGLFINAAARTILTDAEVDRLALGSGSDDQLILGGDLLSRGNSEGGAMSLAGFGDMFEEISLLPGSSYDLATIDGNVGAGHRLIVYGMALDAGHHLTFDGSAETDGHFVVVGGAGDDSLTGGHGADVLNGGGGADLLAGGAGADKFTYFSAAESTGAHHDTILDFTFGEDVIDLPVSVQALDAAVSKGALSQGSFDADLSAVLGGSVLGAAHALFFTPDSGALAGHHFLVVDGNGQAGYQAGADFVIELPSLPPADFHGTGFLV
jgi:hypothetical protein